MQNIEHIGEPLFRCLTVIWNITYTFHFTSKNTISTIGGCIYTVKINSGFTLYFGYYIVQLTYTLCCDSGRYIQENFK